ncbi:MAG: hypothetical protein WCX96_03945 [Bacilli bacterium]
MVYKFLTKQKAISEFDKYLNGENPNYDDLPSFYLHMRNDILRFHNVHKDKTGYEYDLSLALDLYRYFELSKYGYSNLSNYDFWRYICIKVVPDIVKFRHGLVPEYYYKKNVRMYIPTLWWYIHITWQGDFDSTEKVLLKHNTDTIQSLVERPGKQGVYLETYRKIIYFYDLLNDKDKVIVKSVSGVRKNEYLLRSIMVLHTAKCLTVSPELLGEENYVRMLFEQLGKKFN